MNNMHVAVLIDTTNFPLFKIISLQHERKETTTCVQQRVDGDSRSVLTNAMLDLIEVRSGIRSDEICRGISERCQMNKACPMLCLFVARSGDTEGGLIEAKTKRWDCGLMDKMI